MQLKYKITVALVVFVLLIVSVFTVQWVYLNREASTTHGGYRMDETFTAEDLIYGPQEWCPYASKMPLVPGESVDSYPNYYLMFIDLNATSNLNSTFPRVQVDYSIFGLHGNAAFHVYGYIHSNQAVSWTNRVEGDGASGYYVLLNAGKAVTNVLGNAQVLSDFNHVYVKVANSVGASFNDNGNETYFMKFEKEGGGLNTLHITTDPKNPAGQVTQTDSPTGTFFVDFTGDRVQDNFILLVAVKGTIDNDFSLNIKSSVPD